MGMVPRAVKLPLEQLENLHLPAVLHWDMNHFVVIDDKNLQALSQSDLIGLDAAAAMTEIRY